MLSPLKIVVATRNAGKLREIQELLSDLPISLSQLGDYPHIPEIVEDGVRFEDNARKKARVVAEHCQSWALADDSGLEVEVLGGRPGVHSARFAGPNASDADNILHLEKELKKLGLTESKAAFRSVLVLLHPDGREFVSEGRLEGKVVFPPQGSSGFGYDPIFLIPKLRRTLAEMSLEEKNSLSHRAQALIQIHDQLKNLL